ncbi:MAG: hypothetical protein IPK20_16605 [Betaproteobacteria bacterium]|nr:hypothetical protein [Betaproteobacteria bacterium]
MKKFLKSLALVGALGLAGGSVPASAAFEAQLSPAAFFRALPRSITSSCSNSA